MYSNHLVIDFHNRVTMLRAAVREQRGAAMAEYGLLLALIALAAIGALVVFGEEITGVFNDATEAIQDPDGISTDGDESN